MEKVELTAREKLALVTAAAGRHHVLMYGPRSALLLGEILPRLLPKLTDGEAVPVNRIKSIAGLTMREEDFSQTPPVRRPHPTASLEGICGGGVRCMPGEISLAHNGLLFLEDAAEFKSAVLTMLRVPMESGQITLCRAGRSTTYPADFQLALAAQPCPCGNLGSKDKMCLCSAKSVGYYWKKLEPLMDRVDVIVDLFDEAGKERKAYSYEDLRAEVDNAVRTQRNRMHGLRNARLTPEYMDQTLGMDDDAANLLDRMAEDNDWSARRKAGVAKVARTLADLADWESVMESHLITAEGLLGKLPMEKAVRALQIEGPED